VVEFKTVIRILELNMDYIEAPWRSRYIDKAIADEKAGKDICVLCEKAASKTEDDRDNLVLYHGKYNYVLMNLYPYTGGHLMVAPIRHINRLWLLSDEERIEHIDLLSKSLKILDEVYHPAGFNTGINFGRSAGAGIDQHMHNHIVPRWSGDANFMTVLGETRVMNEALLDVYDKLLPYFQKL
jgi:ATP adenylyltransferase